MADKRLKMVATSSGRWDLVGPDGKVFAELWKKTDHYNVHPRPVTSTSWRLLPAADVPRPRPFEDRPEYRRRMDALAAAEQAYDAHLSRVARSQQDGSNVLPFREKGMGVRRG